MTRSACVLLLAALLLPAAPALGSAIARSESVASYGETSPKPLEFSRGEGGQVRIAGAVSGVVADSGDLPVPGALVELRDEATGILKTTTTNTSGAFTFPDLNFGSYEVKVTLQGFRTAVYQQVVVEASRTTDLRIRLELGR